jgi:hypothetical protein
VGLVDVADAGDADVGILAEDLHQVAAAAARAQESDREGVGGAG